MQGQRVVELAFNDFGGSPLYVINRQEIYDAGNLHFLGEYDETERVLHSNVVVTPEWVRQFRTRPLYVEFPDGVAILDSHPLSIVWTDVEDPHTTPIIGTYDITLPDLARPGLVPLNLPQFDPEMRDIIVRLSNLRWSLSNSETIAQQLRDPEAASQITRVQQVPAFTGFAGFPQIPIGGLRPLRSPGSPRGRYSPPRSPAGPPIPSITPQSPRREIPPPQESPVLEALIARLYGLPVTPPQALIVNGLPVPLIPFQEAVQMLQRNEVERYTIDPLNQVWAGPPGTPNRIVTLIRRDGTLSAVVARYDPNTGQIYPPN